MPPLPTDTPPASPIIQIRDDDDDEIYEDDILEEIPVGEGEPVLEDDDEEDGMSGEEGEDLVELPGGIDQLESIIEDYNKPKDISKLVYSNHNKPVFCCCFHPEMPDLVASGGEDDAAYVWNATTGETLHKFDGWKDSVLKTVWSRDGQHLAICDMSGAIKVFKYPGFAEEWSFEVGDILWMSWHPVANVLFCGTADSEMWMWKIPSGDSKMFHGQGEKTECGVVTADGRRAVCGYSDGSVRIFDLKSGSALHTINKGLAHLDSVNEVACHPNNTIMATASMDGTTKLWNSTTGKCVGTLLSGDRPEENSANSVECCVFPQDKSSNFLITGSLDGVVSVWDTPTQISRASTKVGEGVTKVEIHPTEPHLYAATLDGAVRCLDLRSGNPVTEYTGHTANVLDFSFSCDGSRLVTSSDDGTCRIFQIETPAPQ